jgi:hypothetical protein
MQVFILITQRQRNKTRLRQEVQISKFKIRHEIIKIARLILRYHQKHLKEVATQEKRIE